MIVLRSLDKLFSGEMDGDLFKIDQLAAMNLAKSSWQHVEIETIILPVHVQDPNQETLDAPAIQELQEALNLLKDEANLKGRPLDLVEAQVFVDIDANEAVDHDLTLEEIVVLITEPGNDEDVDDDNDDLRQEPLTAEKTFKSLLTLSCIGERIHLIFQKTLGVYCNKRTLNYVWTCLQRANRLAYAISSVL